MPTRPCPHCFGPLRVVWSASEFRCDPCSEWFDFENLNNRQFVVDVFDKHMRFSATVPCVFLLLTGNMKGIIKGGPHSGMEWERTNLKKWMSGK